MNDKFLSFLGLTKKSGNLFMGMDSVKESVVKKQISLILTAKDISPSSLNEINNVALQNSVMIKSIRYTKDEINSATGKYAAIIGIADKNFIKKIITLINDKNEFCEKSNNREEYNI